MITLVLFIIALVTLIVVIGAQLFAFRKGRVNLSAIDPEVENPLSRRNLTIYKDTVNATLEARTRKVTLYALKFSIRLGYSVKARLDSLVSGVHRKMATHERKLKQEENTTDSSTASFLKSIRVHKK